MMGKAPRWGTLPKHGSILDHGLILGPFFCEWSPPCGLTLHIHICSSILVWPVLLAQVLPHPQFIFPSKTWFFGIYLNLQWQKSFKNQYLPHSESKSYQIYSIKSCSSRYFQQHQMHIPIPLKFSATTFNLIFSEEIIQYSRSFALQVQMPRNQAHASLLVQSFPKTQASGFDGSHNYKTNYLPS